MQLNFKGKPQPHKSSNHNALPSDHEVRIVGWQVEKRADGARRLNFAVELPDQGRTVTLSCILIPEDVRLLTRFVMTRLTMAATSKTRIMIFGPKDR